MAGIWGVILTIAVWGWIHESLTHFNNFLAGRPKDAPEGSPGCLYYMVLIGMIYVIALLSQ
jgi:hypothetical protein